MMSKSATKDSPAKEETSPSLFPSSSLPDTIAVISCFPVVQRSNHASLSSPELHKKRSLLGRSTKEHLYVCLRTKLNSTPRWFLLSTETQGTGLIPKPSLPSQPQTFSSVVPLDWGIYVIGGFTGGGDVRSSDVWLLDCRTNTWREVTSMSVGRAAAAAGVVDGKIYVFGGCEEEFDPSNWGEVYDPETETWETLPPFPGRNEGDNVVGETLVMDGKVYAVDFWSRSLLSYSPRDGKWGRGMRTKEVHSYYCVVEEVMYGCDEVGNVVWRESEEVLEWKKVKGLEDLQMVFSGSNSVKPSAFRKRVRKLSSFGVNLVVFWVGLRGEVWCAEISLERREEEGEVWGRIEWSECLAAFQNTYARATVEVLYAASVNV